MKQRRKSVKNILQTVAIIILYFSFLSASLSGEICYATCIWNYKKTKWLLIELKKKTVFWVLRYNFLMTFYLFLSTGEYGVQSPEGYLSSSRFSVCSLPSWQSWSQQSAQTLSRRYVFTKTHQQIFLIIIVDSLVLIFVWSNQTVLLCGMR